MEDSSTNKIRILKMASELFRKFGFRSIAMDDIARHLGMSKKTVYQYFTDKDEIVLKAIEMHLAVEKENLKAAQKKAADAIDSLMKINNFLAANVKEANSALIFELQKYHSRAWSLVEEFKGDFLFNIVLEELKTGIDQGIFRSDINPEVIARVRLEEASLPLDDQLFPINRFNPSEVSLTILDHFISGIVTDKGKKLYQQHKIHSLTNIL